MPKPDVHDELVACGWLDVPMPSPLGELVLAGVVLLLHRLVVLLGPR